MEGSPLQGHAMASLWMYVMRMPVSRIAAGDMRDMRRACAHVSARMADSLRSMLDSMNIRLWFAGARPKTWPASIAPVLVGTAMAYVRLTQVGTCIEINPEPAECTTNRAQQSVLLGHFWPVFALCVLVALLFQIAVNYANDYSDGIRGTDQGRDVDESPSHGDSATAAAVNHGTSGIAATASATAPAAFGVARTPKPRRLVASGVPPKHVLIAAAVAAAFACVCGLAVSVLSQHYWLIAVGALCVIAGWFYTGGRHPYGYAGFGEAAVFVFFGLVATLGTSYVLAGGVDLFAVLAAVACGLNAVALLMVNNLRDIVEDGEHGKRTLAVRLGERGARIAFIAVVVVEELIAALLVTILWAPWGMVILISSLAVPVRMIRDVHHDRFREALGAAGYQTLFFAILFALCVAVDV